MSEDVKLSAYLERIGFAGSIAPTLQTLEALHALQPATIPFENLNSVLGLPVLLDQASLNHKLLTERRGGYCFEQNLMLLRVLRDLGFEARGHLAKVLWGRRDVEGLTTDHMLMTVDVGGVSYLADVGFGGLLLTAPLKLKTGIEQETPHSTYRLTGEEPTLRLEVKRDDDWWPAYEFELTEVDDAGFEERNRELNADPDWFLHQHLLIELCPPTGRRMLYDTRLTLTAETGPETRTLSSVPEMRDTLTSLFNMNLPATEGLDAAFGRILTRNLVTS
jgi:N-hydroxyarylamine O-acetyltransferase